MIDAKGDDQEGGGYISWKPVVYRAPDTHAFNSSSTVQYRVNNHSVETDWINTPLIKLYGNHLFSNESLRLKRAFNVSFGEPKDNYYAKSNYLYW